MRPEATHEPVASSLHIQRQSLPAASPEEIMHRRAAALALCVAASEAFSPAALGGAGMGMGVRRAQGPALSVRMQSEDGPRADRRAILRAAALAVLPLAAGAPTSASAEFEMPNPADLLGNPRGERPAGLGAVGNGRNQFLSLCDSGNCVSTSEDVYSKRFLPPWTYNNEGESDKDEEEAMAELVAVVKGFKGAKIVKQTPNYLYAEFERELGFVDDVEFLIKTDEASGAGTVEYRSAARKSKKSDHRSRIKALRLELQKKGWKSVGYR